MATPQDNESARILLQWIEAIQNRLDAGLDRVYIKLDDVAKENKIEHEKIITQLSKKVNISDCKELTGNDIPYSKFEGWLKKTWAGRVVLLVVVFLVAFMLNFNPEFSKIIGWFK